MKGKISIIIPVYNGAQYLAQTMDSISNQTYRNFEIICINDASTDNSYEILESYSEKFSINIINLKKNVGLVPHLIKQFGIPRISGEFYMYMSQDDFLSHDCLEQMISVFDNLRVDAVIPDFVYYTGTNNDSKIIGVNGNRNIILNGKEAFTLSLNWQIPGAALWRSELVKRMGYEDFNMYADEFTVRKYFLGCEEITFCEGIFFYRINNPEAITKKMKPEIFSKVFKESKLLELVYFNCDAMVFNDRVKFLINMFFDYHQIFFDQKFKYSEIKIAKNSLRDAFNFLNNFLKNINYLPTGYNLVLKIKFRFIRSNYLFFYTFCKIKYLLNKGRKIYSF